MSNQTVICVTESIRNVVSTTVHPLVIELNNTSLIYQLRRRVTHSKEAFEALLYIGGLTSIVIISVLCTKMWRDKSYLAVNHQQRIEYTQNGPQDEILVKGKELLYVFFSNYSFEDKMCMTCGLASSGDFSDVFSWIFLCSISLS